MGARADGARGSRRVRAAQVQRRHRNPGKREAKILARILNFKFSGKFETVQ